MNNPLSLLLLSSVAWFGCGGAVQEPEVAPVKVAAVEAPSPKKAARDNAPAGDEEQKDENKAKAEAIAKALSELDVQVLGALGQSEPVDIIGSGEVPEGILDEAAAASTGTSTASVDHGGGLVRAGTGGTSLAGLPAVRGDARIGPVTVNNGTLADAESTIGRYRSRFRSCYERGLRTDPSQKGSLVLEIDVLSTGRVDAVRTAVVQGVDHDVTSCIQQRARSFRFSAPSSDVTLAFQITLSPR